MYNKLFTKILDSSIWLESTPTRIVWLTMIAVMDQDGFAQFAAPKNVAHRARVSPEEAEEALRVLESPDPDSSNPDNEGRRIERVPGGWLVLNADKHREIVTRTVEREQNRIRVQRHRDKKRPTVTSNTDTITSNGSEAEAAADVTAEAATHSETVLDSKNKLTCEVVASTKEPTSRLPKPQNGHDSRSKRPIFSGQRLTVFEWFLDKAEQTLGTKLLNEFDIHEWFFSLDTAVAKTDVVIPQRDNGAWLTEQLLTEAARRGLPIAIMPTGNDKTAGNAEALQRFLERHS